MADRRDTDPAQGVEIVSGYAPGAHARIVAMHASYYGAQWGFGRFFERKVADGLAEFLGRFDPAVDGLWTARIGMAIEGAIALDGEGAHPARAHLRWFCVSDRLRGKGAGGALLRKALAFADECGYESVYLCTFAGLDSARHLYEREGFVLADERVGSQWGKEVLEQRFERPRGSGA